MLREYLTLMGYRMNLPVRVVDTFRLAATIHDCFLAMIGKTEDRNNPEDPSHGPYHMAELTEKFDFFADEREVLLAHNEHYDGSGLPLGLEKDQIPMGARIFSIAETFVSLCLELESGETGMDAAVLALAEKAGTVLDPRYVFLFLKSVSECEPHKISRQTLKEAERIIQGRSGETNGGQP